MYFVTFRLADSLPRAVLRTFEAERKDILARAEQMGREPSAHERKRLAELFSQRVESHLDKGSGACHLRNPQVADAVASALNHFNGQRYRLFAWCIMPNHVHIVFKPFPNHVLADILQTWKSYAAKEANRLLGRKGTFWQKEYYDHLIRNEGEFERVVQYVMDNPAKAGLQDWQWLCMCGQDAPTTAGKDAGGTPGDSGTGDPAGSTDRDAGGTGGSASATDQSTADVPSEVPGASRPREEAPEQDLDLTEDKEGNRHGDAPSGTFGPEDVFDYMYAVFHSPTYRTRYAEFLKIDFPRLPLTSNLDLFRELCHLGDELVGLHLMEKRATTETRYEVSGENRVEKVRYTEPGQGAPTGRVWINKTQYFDNVPPDVWQFHIGGYQVCQKWLKDRKGRTMTYDDLTHYQHIVSAFRETIRLMAEIDRVIEAHGGWPIK